MVGNFSLKDYDVIGFDLDYTLLVLKLSQMFLLQYHFMSNYLVKEKGYSRSVFPSDLTEEDADFILRGLILDAERGNLLYVRHDGYVMKACHGRNTVLSRSEIQQLYGKDSMWSALVPIINDKRLLYHNHKVTAYFDYATSIGALMFAKAVDSVDLTQGKVSSYNVLPDLMEAFAALYAPESSYVKSIVEDLPKYANRISEEVAKWLKEIKKHHRIFLITNGTPKLTDRTLNYWLFDKLDDLFDLVVVSARKPYFFYQTRPFLTMEGNETEINLERKNGASCYQKGSWCSLHDALTQTLGRQPKFLYVGDNALKDVYVPAKCSLKIDTVAVLEEIFCEAKKPAPDYPYCNIVSSKFWGPMLKSTSGDYTLVGDMVRETARLAVPSVEYLTQSILRSYP